MKGDPTKYPEWYKNYLRGIMQVESSGGNPNEFINPRSSATGMYQQLYKQVKDLPVMQGVDRQGFAADTALQNKVMGMRFLDDLPGVTGELRNARDLTERFAPQFGDKWNYRPDEVAAMTYFIGRQGTINYLNHLLKGGKPEDFKVSGNNMTVPKYMQVYNEGFGAVGEQPEERQISPELQNAIDIMKRDNRFGGRVVKKKNYGQNGMLVQKDPTLQQDPPQGTITPQEALMRALQPENQFRLTGGEAPFRPIKEQRDPVETLGKGIAEVVRMLPFAGEVVDTYELGKVAATGEDVYGEEQDPGLFAALTAAGYVIPNVLEKPLKSAWRAVKKFPAKMPKKEFRELKGPEKEQVRQNLIQAHNEVYDPADGLIPVNVRQLPSLMSGSKLENAVGKDGMIQVSQIENLINSKDISAAEKEALQDALFRTRSRAASAAGLEPGSPLPDKIDYLSFKRAGSDVVSTRRGDATFFVDEVDEYADYGLNNLGDDIRRMKDKDATVTARTNLIRTTDPELQSTEYGHFGEDVIGHYRTFDRADEPGVLYISELQSDPLQARGSAGQKTVGLDVSKPVDVDAQLKTARIQLEAAEKHLAEVRAGAPYNPQKVYGAEGLPTGRGSLDDPRAITATNKAEALGADDITVLRETDLEALTPMARAQREADFMAPTEQLISFMDEHKRYIQALEGGYRGGPNAKQANLIKNQDQFLISHILEQEAKGADKLRFPTGETTAKIQGYGGIEAGVERAQRQLGIEESNLKNLMTEPGGSPSRLAQRVEGMGLSGVDPDKALDFLGRVRAYRTRGGVPRDLASDSGIQYNQSIVEKFDNDALRLAYKEIKEQLPPGQRLKDVTVSGGTIESAAEARAIQIKEDIQKWNEQIERIKSRKEHLSRVNASTQATQGIMKGYDRLPKALKKHGLDATKVTDDAGNTWWEVDIPARLGEGVGEIRAYRKGGQVSDKIRVLKKEGKPQDQAVAIALAMKQKGQL
jgi:hypothetical protein